MKVDFDAITPAERKLILVASDRRYEELIRQTSWMRVIGTAALALPAYLANDREAVRALSLDSLWSKRIARNDIPIPHLSPAEASRRFRFDLGGPEDGVAYVLNPCVQDHYILPALMNERVAQEKLAAFAQIASSLGAKTVHVVAAEIVQKRTKAAARVPLPEAAAQIGLAVEFDADGGIKRRIWNEFDPPSSPPFVPRELEGWLRADPVLRGLVHNRCTSRLRVARASLQLGEAVDVGAAVIVALAKWNIGIGGKHRSISEVNWTFEIEFWPAA